MGPVTIRNVIDHYPGLVFMKDKESRFIDANQSFIKSAGFKNIEQMRSLTDYEMPWCNLAKEYIKDDQTVITEGCLLSIEPFKHCNGHHQVLFTQKSRFIDEQTQSEGIVGFATAMEWNNIKAMIPMNIEKDLPTLKISDQLFDLLIEKFSPQALTKREAEVFFYLLHGLSYRQIANQLNLSMRTVEDYVEKIKDKLRCDNKQQLIEIAISCGLINVIPEQVFKKIVTKKLI
jgi:DNA-binding CsgD family transcriptional regulator